MVKALWIFDARDPQDLSVKKGDVVEAVADNTLVKAAPTLVSLASGRCSPWRMSAPTH